MKTKAFIGTTLLLLGFVLGAIAFYFLSEKSGVSLPPVQVISPRVTGEITDTGKSFSYIVNTVSPAVVNISTVKLMTRKNSFSDDPFFEFFNDFFNPFDFGLDKKWKEQSLGSGVIVSNDGYIITNYHVVSNADKIKVTLFDRRVFKGKIIGADPKTDIAVVKISANNLPMVPWGDSDNMQVGEFVLAIGNPFGLSHTVTMGIISAVGRANVGIADYEDFIQTDAAINPGNSGGPLVSTNGDLRGINTAIVSRSGGYQGIGFAVPSDMARLIMEQLVKEGKVAIYSPTEDSPAEGQAIRIFQAGEMLGEMALIDQQPRSLSARAEEATTIMTLSGDDFQELLAENFQMVTSVMGGLNDRIR